MSIIIDGARFDVRIAEHEQAADVIDKFAERTESGVLQHEVLGVYFNFEIEFEPIEDPALHEQFYEVLTQPKEEWRVTLPGRYTTHTFRCYIRVQPVKMIRHKSTGNRYEGLKVNFIAIEPARRR